MEYYKLIALSIGDISSHILFEDNYGANELDKAEKIKKELENKGHVCILIKTNSAMQIHM